jgi:hypothetical protein
MLNIFQKPVVIDCYTDNPHAFEYAKPSKATEFLPKWWKSLPKDGHANMSRCAGFIDLYRKSYVLPMWSDFDVWFNPDGSYNWQYADLRSEAQVHDQAQYTGWASWTHISLFMAATRLDLVNNGLPFNTVKKLVEAGREVEDVLGKSAHGWVKSAN